MMTSGDDLDRDGMGPDDLQDVGMGPGCPKCGNKTDWLPCWNCGGEGGFDGYDDDPLWYDEGDVIGCPHCRGTGGWWRCWDCKECFDHLGEGGEVGSAAASSSGGGAGEDAREYSGEEDHCACVDRDRAACFRMRYGIEDLRDLAEEGGPCECVCHDRWEAVDEEDGE